MKGGKLKQLGNGPSRYRPKDSVYSKGGAFDILNNFGFFKKKSSIRKMGAYIFFQQVSGNVENSLWCFQIFYSSVLVVGCIPLYWLLVAYDFLLWLISTKNIDSLILSNTRCKKSRFRESISD